MSVIRAVDDYQGINAWQRLHLKKYPRTMAMAIGLLDEVANPTPAKNVGEVEATLNKWESKMTQLTKQYGEEPAKNDMKIATKTSILPAVIQDFVCQHVGSKTKYADISEKVKAGGKSGGHGQRADSNGHWRSEMGQQRLQHAGGGDRYRHCGDGAGQACV